jgi:hypothetical protein
MWVETSMRRIRNVAENRGTSKPEARFECSGKRPARRLNPGRHVENTRHFITVIE